MKHLLSFIAIAMALVVHAQSVSESQSSLPASSLVDAQIDSLIAQRKIIYIDGKPQSISAEHADSVRRLMDMFYFDQYRHFSEPSAPYFMFMSKDATLAMGIGGCVRLRGWYEWGGQIPVNGFIPYLINMNPDPAAMKKFGTTAAGTTLFFRVIGRNKRYGEYQLYIEANFNGYNSLGFELKKAYASIGDFTLGYAESTFSDPMAITPTVDAAGPNNKISPTSVLARYMHTFKQRWTIAASLETPSSRGTYVIDESKKSPDWLPDAAAFVQYGWGRSEHVRLSGIVRTLSYRNLIENKNHTSIGWGAQLSAVAHPVAPLTLYGTLSGGKGYESLGGDMQIGDHDLIPHPDLPGHLYEPFAMGWNIGVQYNFRPNLFACVSYSESRYFPKKPTADHEYKYGNFVAANLFWNLTPRIMTGIEYDYGTRHNTDGKHRGVNRVGAMAMFAF